MGRLLKKGKEGIAAQYLSRNRAVKKLQISLKDFRRLCILKGIFPRDPKKKPEGNNNTTYYHKKDVQFLAREPLLDKFRQFKTFLKKYYKAKTRKEADKADRIKKRMPKLVLDHLIRERYPTFVDALRDLDDPLSMLNLFAHLPSGTTHNHTSERYQTCLRLTREFNNYVIQTNALRKCFVSIKGIYFQAEIEGQAITWIVPHKFSQDLPVDVDYRVMMTFLDFYETLLRFVNFKLYHEIGLMYPPEINVSKENEGFSHSVIVNHRINTSEEDSHADEETEAFGVMQEDGEVDHRIFNGKVFYLGRETPQDILEFVILSCGGSVILENSLHPEFLDDDSITHHIVDRNLSTTAMKPSREYIQPQWVFDSCNVCACLPISPYAPGETLPAHISPFVDDEAEGYVPKQKEILEEWTSGSRSKDTPVNDEVKSTFKVSTEQEYLEDLSKELSGVPYSQNTISTNETDEDDEKEVSEADLAKIMMSKKHTRLYTRMQHGIKKKQAATDSLKTKREKLEKDK